MNIIETKNLTKYYFNGTVIGVKNLNLTVLKGEVFGFIGPNGAGKTTTIRLLLDLIRPTKGTASVFGLDVLSCINEIKKHIGFLPGEIFLPEHLTGKQCIDYYAGFKIDSPIDEVYATKIIKQLDFNPKKKISTYSKGNKQKLAIILALMHKPKLLILDEPTSGLDPLIQQEFYSIIAETKKWGATTFLSTHLLNEAEKICDRVGILKDGELIRIENVEEFKEKNIHKINLVTKENIPLSEFRIEGIQKIVKTVDGYQIITKGENGQIIKYLAKYHIEDYKITEPSLEEIFIHFYKN